MIPDELQVDKNFAVPINKVPGFEKFGCWDESTLEITINSDLPKCGQYLVLIHEMIHMAEHQLISCGVLGWVYANVVRGIWGEKLVTYLAPYIFSWLALSNMLNGVTPEEAQEFIDNELQSMAEEINAA